jgi:VWFA-related protein
MQPNDRVAIYQTKGGSNLLQQYTSNKDQLLRTIRKIRYYPPVFRCGAGVFDEKKDDSTLKRPGAGRETFEDESSKIARESDENFNRNNQIIGTLGVLNFAVERLKPISGRKIVFFLSDGLEFQFGSRALDSFRVIVDNASRSSVIINTVDSRGFVAPGGLAGSDLPSDASELLKQVGDSQQGLKYLANETGGSYIVNQNKIDVGIGEILADQSGYYLIGYQPNDETFKNKDFHNIEVKIKNPDLKVVSRSGFFGVEDKPQKVVQKTADSPLYQAITAPIQESGIESRLTTLYYNDIKKGSFVRTLFYLNGQDLTLVDEPNGMIKLSLDVVTVTLDEKNKVVSEFNRTHTTRLPKQAAATILQNGFVYSADIPLEKKGAYSFRIAVRDVVSKRIASASDFIEVPDAKKETFYMSGLITAENGQNGIPIFPAEKDTDKALSPITNLSNPAVRQYRSGDSLFYAYTVYNPKIDKTSKKPNITTQIRLFRDGNLLVEGKENPIELDNQTNLARIYDKGSIRITSGVQAGEYILQIVVKDKLTNKTSTQFIDFEVIN